MVRAFLVTFLLSSISFADSAPYEERLEMVEELGLIFPGKYDKKYHDYTLYGMWAGIAFQTQWQMGTPFGRKRSEIVLWEKINRTLTVVPHKYAKAWREEGKVDCSKKTDSAQSPVLEFRKAICKSWIHFFIASDTSNDEKWIQQLMWDAHELAIQTAIVDFSEELIEADVPDEEYWFWKGWTNTVQYIAKKNIASNTDFSTYAGKLPDCVLGYESCSFDELPRVQQGHACVHIRLALEKNPEWVEKISTWLALRLPEFILEKFYSNPAHCKKAKSLLELNPKRI